VGEQLSPKSLIDKLGVKPGARVSVLGVDDAAFLTELELAGADVSRRRRTHSDLLFVRIESTMDLARLTKIEPYMKPSGAVWAVFRRGRKVVREVDVIGAGVAAGLVDNKVVRFSDTHTALRFVIPLARR
jgi:hypothetical protein